MKKIYTLLFFFGIYFGISQNLYATHAAGGELVYELVPNTTNQYKFTFKFYRDCSGVAEPNTFNMCYNNSCGVNNQSVTLSKLVGLLPNGKPNGSPILTTGCYNGPTICEGGNLPGYREWWYTGTVTLNTTCNFWRFWVSLCCRNNAIGNIVTPGSQNIFVEATFDNTIHNLNSSPFIASPPIAYFCANTPSTAYYTAIDPNGDSLTYESINPRHAGTACNNLNPVNIFSAPYTFTDPFPTGNTFIVNPVTGVITFTPTMQGAWVFTIKVNEYRNGQYIGFIMRDIQFVVTVCNLPNPLNVFGIYSPILCYGGTTTLTALGSGGVAPYQYQFNGGGFQANNQLANAVAGVYTINIMDASGCIDTSILTINQPPPFVANVNNIINPLCGGLCTGTAQASVTGGVPPCTYSISAPGIINANSGAISSLCNGNYTVTATDANGCTATTTLTINAPVLTVNINNIVDVSCNGNCNGSANATTVGGANPITYSITAPGNINAANGTMTNLCIGNYTVTVTDANGCTGSASFAIVGPLMLVNISNIVAPLCNGQCSGTAVANATGGFNPITYSISAPGVINPTTGAISGLCAGTYTVSASDANTCTGSTVFTVSTPPALTIVVSNIIDETCYGLCNGSSKSTASGGVVPYTYSISAPGITNPATGANSSLCGGNYTVTVTDANGCTATSVFTITPATLINVSVTNITNVTCNGLCNGTSQTTALGGIPPYTYAISAPGIANPATGANTNLCAGTYTVTVTDASGCTGTTQFAINQAPILSVNVVDISPVSCNGMCDATAQATGTGGTSPYSYAITAPALINATSGAITGLCNGSYTITVTDANGCSASIVHQILQPAILSWSSATVTNVTCFGATDGSITTTTTGGTAPINYNLQPTNQNNATGIFTNLIAGVYTVLATDANGCSISTILTITEPPVLQISAVANTQPTCVPGNDGTITITASGGTPTYVYNIGGANQAGNVFNNVAAGNYTITVTDANGCTATSAITIAPPTSPIITSLVATDVLCNGASTGSITATATGGLGALNYNIQPTNQNNANGIFTNLAAGVYTVTVGDANGCTISSTISILEPTILSWTVTTITNVNCNGGNDGNITVQAAGGTGLINYNLQPNNINNNTGVFPNLNAGNYTITATDANGCTLTTVVQITEPPILAWANAIVTNVTCFGATDGSITTTTTGGTAPINYNLQPTNQNNATGIFTNLIAGVYTVLATDANGCSISTILTITEPPVLQISAVANTQPTCVPGNDGTITITASGGTPTYVYNIGGANQAGNVFTNVAAGNYTITVTDANGCTATSAITIAPPTSPIITSLVATDVLCNGASTGTITATATGGLGALNYNLQPTNQNNANGIFNNLAAGVYTVTVGDANGCTTSSTISISQPIALSWTQINVVNVNCNGATDGSITVTASGGTGAISYNLQPNNINNLTGIFPNLTAGAYTITATDANNCTLTIFLQVTQPLALTWVTATVTDVICNGANNGTITTLANGGNGLINYNLQPGNQNNATGIFANLIAGNYTVLATDANGCTLTTQLTILEPPILQLSITTTPPSCVPGNDATINIVASGGTPSYLYNIGGANQANNVFNNISAGTYTITVTDMNGCTVTSVLIITPPSAPVITAAVTTDAQCSPANTGTITITAFGGTGIYTYSANGINFQPGNVITGLLAGIYTVTVVDAIGCTATSIVNIGTTPSPIITNILVTEATCIPGCDATATISATGGNAVYTYSIDNINFQVSNVFNNLCVNAYTATVIDGNGCTATSSFSIAQANPPVIAVNNTTNILCNGGNNGAISVTAIGVGIINYLLQPNGITNNTGLFSNLTAFSYTVVATDASGCSASTVVTITEPPLLQFVTITNTPPLCAGANNGTLDIVTTGGTGIVNYTINPFANFVPPSSFNNLIGNTTYTITATDANGCSITSSVYIVDPQPIIFTSTSTTDVTCNAGSDGSISVQAIGGTGILNYSIAPNPQNNLTGIFNNLNANTYTVTVTDANNCTLTTVMIINEPLPIIINTLNYTDITCSNFNNGTINISCSGGTGVISYNLQPVNITNTSGIFNGLVANVYTINVTDANGCSISTLVTIVNPLPLIIDSVITTNVLCNGDSNANFSTYASGGIGLLTYNILPQNINNNTGVFNALPAGTYTVTVTDINLCSTNTIVVITEPQILIIAIGNVQNILCSGAPTGQIDLVATGGTQPYTFTLLPINLVNGTGIFTNLNAGNYSATVVDANGCTAIIEPIAIIEPLPIKFDLITKQDIKCFGDSSGWITVTASGGTGNITFSLLPNIGLQNPPGSFTLLTANNYTITATDANNCTLTTTATIVQNPAIIITNVLTVDLKCYGDAVGIINVAAIGGVGTLTYSLNNQNPNNTGFFNNLLAGNYVVTVTDTLGCGIDSVVAIKQPDKIFLNALDIFSVYCTGYSDGKIIATAGGGNGGFTYYLRPGISINKTGYFGDLHEGTYTLTVKDSLGCTFDTVLAVTPPLDPLTLFITKKDLGCYGNGTEGWAQANLVGGTPPFSYLWNSSPPQFDAVASGLKYGKYIVEVVDARGCKEKDSIVIDPGTCCEEVFIPNAFSPNGDGVNDIFRVTTATGIELKQFEVYDRWGKKVWYTNDFREGWDGTDRGALRDMNTYYYIFWYICLTDGETYMKKGDVNLIR
jgi:gliding motility-associated-like protein